VAVTFTAAYHKVLNANPRIGFLAHARRLVSAGGDPKLIFNDRLDAAVAGTLVVLVAVVLIESSIVWASVLSGNKIAEVKESPFVRTRLALEDRA
jgi:hypothetical protein